MESLTRKFRKKPVVIEAVQLTKENKDMVFNWIPGNVYPVWVDKLPAIKIETLEGDMIAQVGDWVIKGTEGEFYPCKDKIFKDIYEEVK